jgi:hypothetical protein
MKRKAITIGIVLAMIMVAFAMMANVSGDGTYGTMKEKWLEVYEGGNSYYSYCNPVIDSQGNVIVGAYGYDYTISFYYHWLILKYDTSGNLLWSRTWWANSFDYYYFEGLAVDEYDNIYAYGDGDNGIYDDIWVVKFDPYGTQLWQTALGWSRQDYAVRNGIVYDNGLVYVTGYGYAYGSTANGYEMLTFCLSAASGAPLWSRAWHSPFMSGWYSDYATGIVVEGDNVITGGQGYWTLSSDYDFLVVAYNKYSGALMWQSNWGSTSMMANTDYMYDLCSDGAGNVFACGYTLDWWWFEIDYAVAGWSASTGTLLWGQTYSGAYSWSWDFAYSVAACPVTGQVYVTGECQDDPFSWYAQCTTICYDSATGVILWKDSVAGSNTYYCGGQAIEAGPSGTVYVAAVVENDWIEYWDMTVLAYTPSGALKWEWYYDGYDDYDDDRADGLYVDANENVAASGQTYGFDWYSDVATVMFVSAIDATCRMEPQSLNLDSNGNWVSFKVEGFPENPEYDPNDVDPTSCQVGGIDADLKFGTHNNNHYIGKADRLLVEDAIGAPGEEVEVDVTGSLYDGTNFIGTAVIKAILN